MDDSIECTVQELAAQLAGDPAPRLVDVREPLEWETVRLEQARRLDQALFDEIVGTWPRDVHIVCYCHHGIRSMHAARFLREHGFTRVQSLRGGIDAWAREIDPTLYRY
ncbi:MAG: sulfurtransferase [Candidatus Lambdaproteobacteria bacterium]|nr:sulfurtransferase [Candidatus Lambdaproteobacteria bacterium]